jgi:hypothetical protein
MIQKSASWWLERITIIGVKVKPNGRKVFGCSDGQEREAESCRPPLNQEQVEQLLNRNVAVLGGLSIQDYWAKWKLREADKANRGIQYQPRLSAHAHDK